MLRVLTPDEVKALGPVEWIKVEPQEIHEHEISELALQVFKTRQDYSANSKS